MEALAQRGSSAGPSPGVPASLVRQAVRFEPAIEPPRDEWFIAGTEQAVVTRAARPTSASLIAQPIDHSVLALDPDIPPQAQRLHFTPASALPRGWRWRLDGRALGAAVAMTWAPWPGAHRLELIDARGTVRETVQFEVRGAQARRTAARASR
jgi:penicillin-binding protein 1C